MMLRNYFKFVQVFDPSGFCRKVMHFVRQGGGNPAEGAIRGCQGVLFRGEQKLNY